MSKPTGSKLNETNRNTKNVRLTEDAVDGISNNPVSLPNGLKWDNVNVSSQSE